MRTRFVLTLLLLMVLPMLAVVAAPAQVAQTEPAESAAVANDAASLVSPYEVAVPVADTSAALRAQAFRTALQRVLARVAGEPVSARQLAAVAADPASYVRQYRYRPVVAGSQPYDLVVSFAASAIEHLRAELVTASLAQTADSGLASAASSAVAGPVGLTHGEVRVSGVTSALDFAAVLQALRQAPGVEQVHIRAAQGDWLTVALQSNVALTRVIAGLERSGRFTAEAATTPGDASILGLHWVH